MEMHSKSEAMCEVVLHHPWRFYHKVVICSLVKPIFIFCIFDEKLVLTVPCFEHNSSKNQIRSIWLDQTTDLHITNNLLYSEFSELNCSHWKTTLCQSIGSGSQKVFTLSHDSLMGTKFLSMAVPRSSQWLLMTDKLALTFTSTRDHEVSSVLFPYGVVSIWS